MTTKAPAPCPTCNHVFEDGHQCGSPALRGERHCYFHHPSRKPVKDPYARRSRRGFQITAPTNHQELMHVLNEVLQRLASNKLDVHRAGLILYNLQLTAQYL